MSRKEYFASFGDVFRTEPLAPLFPIIPPDPPSQPTFPLRFGDTLRLGGIEVQESPLLTEFRQFRFPRSKRKRIRKKWRRNKRNWRSMPARSAYMVDTSKASFGVKVNKSVLVVPPGTVAKLKKEFG